MSIKKKYHAMLTMKPIVNVWRDVNQQYPSFEEYLKAFNEGRVVQDDKKCIITSNNVRQSFQFYKA